MKLIPLTQGQSAIVSDWWYDHLMQWKWQAQWDKTTQSYYAIRTEYKPRKKKISMHRVVAKTPDGMLCDHIHHNTLDNREEELRNVTHSQSCINRRLRTDNKSGKKGVRKLKNCDVYWATLKVKGEFVLSKGFRTFDEAVEAREKAEQKYNGKFNHKDVS